MGGSRGKVPKLICIVPGKAKSAQQLCDKSLSKRFASFYRCMAFSKVFSSTQARK